MKRVLKIVLIVAVVIFAGIQFIRIDRTNPPVDPALSIEAHMNVPSDVQMVLARSCNDCHSHKTVYPWYSHVAPVSWWLRDHIDHGRSHMNFSEWGKYDSDKRSHKLEEICDMVRSRQMPLPSYLWMHGYAVLSESDINTLCTWAMSEQAKIVL